VNRTESVVADTLFRYLADLPAMIHAEDVSVYPAGRAVKSLVCGRSLAGIAFSNPARGHGCLSLLKVVGLQAEVSATGPSFVQRNLTQNVCMCVCVCVS
jgi:hypothetical protein